VAATPPKPIVREADLHRWKLVEAFQERLARAAQQRSLPASWSDPQRLLTCGDYLGLFLFGLLNPVVGTMRGLCAASRLGRVQREVCSRPVSLGSFSEAQALLEPELLQEVFRRLTEELPAGAEPAPSVARRWLIQDGSLFDALPRMYWALWRRQGKAQSQVRLHLSLDLDTRRPARAMITAGKTCERAAWRAQWQRGDGYVGDRYYGENYQLFAELQEAGVAFVVRLRDEAVIQAEEELPLSAADVSAKVTRGAWARLGCKPRYRSLRVRVVWVQTPKEILRLATNLGPAELTAAEVAVLYQQRWQIELFFRWVKCILGCRHWLAESPQGVAVEIYLALIAALLLQLYTGQRPTRRMMELIRFYLLGVATLDELEQGLQRELAQVARRKKS
jgi:hypothetical protein